MIRNGLFAAVSLIFIFFIYCFLQFTVPLSLEQPLEVRIEKGMTFRAAVNVLSQHGLVRDSGLFIALGKLTGIDRRLKAGYYSFFPSFSPWDVFMSLKEGRTIEFTVTVVEGDSLNEIGQKLKAYGFIDEEKFESLSKDEAFLNDLGITAPSLEGYLFPDTYRFPKGAEPEEILKTMVDRLMEKYASDMLTRTYELGLDVKSVLTLASIIEKEAATDSERPLISAVFHNRLKKGIPLQADPTAIYGVKLFSEGVTKNDLTRKTDYNTYIIKGLPPGPIASAGLKSIKAALYPENVPYLYFVSNNDGTHTFSSNLKEHQKAVEMYRIKKGSSEEF